jgi:hypothetical protein
MLLLEKAFSSLEAASSSFFTRLSDCDLPETPLGRQAQCGRGREERGDQEGRSPGKGGGKHLGRR